MRGPRTQFARRVFQAHKATVRRPPRSRASAVRRKRQRHDRPDGRAHRHFLGTVACRSIKIPSLGEFGPLRQSDIGDDVTAGHRSPGAGCPRRRYEGANAGSRVRSVPVRRRRRRFFRFGEGEHSALPTDGTAGMPRIRPGLRQVNGELEAVGGLFLHHPHDDARTVAGTSARNCSIGVGASSWCCNSFSTIFPSGTAGAREQEVERAAEGVNIGADIRGIWRPWPARGRRSRVEVDHDTKCR